MILPEACKFLQCENTSVNSLVQDISNLLQGFNTDQVLKQVEYLNVCFIFYLKFRKLI